MTVFCFAFDYYFSSLLVLELSFLLYMMVACSKKGRKQRIDQVSLLFMLLCRLRVLGIHNANGFI